MKNAIDRQTIGQVIDLATDEDLITCIEKSFTSYSSGIAVVPPVGTLSFESPPGDVHIKYGYIKGEQHYVIKIASGFYENPDLGLPSGNGLNLVFNQKTGELETVLFDHAYLTDVRTALAGAVAAKYLGPSKVQKIGILGTGVQARLQLRYLKTITDCRSVMIWGRSQKNCQKYIDEMSLAGFDIELAKDAADLALACNLIVTNTPSRSPILPYVETSGDTLITAVGADTIGKCELDPKILLSASLIALDSTSQCQDHGEIHKEFAAGNLDSIPMREIGSIIEDTEFVRPKGLIVADLTGIATQDMLISSFVLDHLS